MGCAHRKVHSCGHAAWSMSRKLQQALCPLGGPPFPKITSVGDVHPEGCFAGMRAFRGSRSLPSASFSLLSVRGSPAAVGSWLVLGRANGVCCRHALAGSFLSGQVQCCIPWVRGGRGCRTRAVVQGCVLSAFSLGAGLLGPSDLCVPDLKGCLCCRRRVQCGRAGRVVDLHPAVFIAGCCVLLGFPPPESWWWRVEGSQPPASCAS